VGLAVAFMFALGFALARAGASDRHQTPDAGGAPA
jgi:hypothetical protein